MSALRDFVLAHKNEVERQGWSSKSSCYLRRHASYSPDVMLLMTTNDQPPEVLTLTQVRSLVSQTVNRFRREGITSEPVIFGHHGKPEAVTLPYEMYEALLPAVEEVLLAVTVRARLAGAPSSWNEVLADLSISQEDIDAVELDKYTILPE